MAEATALTREALDALVARATHFTVADLFRRSARVHGDRPAIVSADVALTYRELDERTDRLAHVLAGEGLEHGDRLTVLSGTRPEYIEVYLAAAKLGVTVVALNVRLAHDELVHCVALTGPRLLLAAPGQEGNVAALQDASATTIERVLWLPGRGGDADSDYERRLAAAPAQPPPPAAEPDDIHCILFTSGTTGRPKGAMISERASVMRAMRCADWFELTPADGMIGWIPMYHTGGDECVKATFLSGGTFATFERADPETLYAGIERHRLTWTAMLPGIITDFLDHPKRGDYDLSSLRFALGYANMMPQVVQEFTKVLNADFWDTYGQTESSFVVALDRVSPNAVPSLRKTPAPLLDVRLVDPELNEVPVGEPGECVVRGPSVMSGYVEDPAATADVFRGGWLHTGDVLVRHEDGTLTYVDRLKYLIKTGGENVYPAEIEQVLTSHPAVREACAVSVPDARWGETVKAFIVLQPGQTCAGAELRDFARERLASFKTPRYIAFLDVDDVPRSGTGKILRNQLEQFPTDDSQRV